MKMRLANRERTQTTQDVQHTETPPTPTAPEASEPIAAASDHEGETQQEAPAPGASSSDLQDLAAEIERLRAQPNEDHSMMVPMDVLQTCGVGPETACAVASSLARDDGRHQRLLQRMHERRSCVHARTGHQTTFV